MKSFLIKFKPGLLLVLLLQIIVVASCTSTLYVAPRQGDCTGLSDQKCFLIRYSTEGNWILHNEKITGFDYEPGFSYKIKVKKEHVKNPTLGGYSNIYSLKKVIEKEDVTDDMELSDLIGKDWKLEYLSQDGIETSIEDKIPTLRFSDEGKISGNGGCNNFFGSFTLTGRTLRFSEIGSTKMMCDTGSEMESVYFKVLALELRGLFVERKLILSGDGGNRMVFSYN